MPVAERALILRNPRAANRLPSLPLASVHGRPKHQTPRQSPCLPAAADLFERSYSAPRNDRRFPFPHLRERRRERRDSRKRERRTRPTHAALTHARAEAAPAAAARRREPAIRFSRAVRLSRTGGEKGDQPSAHSCALSPHREPNQLTHQPYHAGHEVAACPQSLRSTSRSPSRPRPPPPILSLDWSFKNPCFPRKKAMMVRLRQHRPPRDPPLCTRRRLDSVSTVPSRPCLATRAVPTTSARESRTMRRCDGPPACPASWTPSGKKPRRVTCRACPGRPWRSPAFPPFDSTTTLKEVGAGWSVRALCSSTSSQTASMAPSDSS